MKGKGKNGAGPDTSGKGKPRHGFGEPGATTRPRPPLKAEHRPAAQEVVREQPAVLEDLVAMCNLAARHGCGSVVALMIPPAKPKTFTDREVCVCV